MKRILITGSRDWDDSSAINDMLTEAWTSLGKPQEVTLVSGACPTGADAMCEEFARNMKWTIERYPAEWDRYGKRAGFLRNLEMVTLGADVCVAFIKNRSRGASMTYNMAKDNKIPVKVRRADG